MSRGDKMSLKAKYILSGIFVTIGCIIGYISNFYPLAIILICLPSFILNFEKLKSPIKINPLKWDRKFLAKIMVYLLIVSVLIITFSQIPDEKGKVLFRKWYYALTFWIIVISGIFSGYLSNNKKAQQGSSQGFGG